jgi:hypothetical protein
MLNTGVVPFIQIAVHKNLMSSMQGDLRSIHHIVIEYRIDEKKTALCKRSLPFAGI